ncbi:MAG: hypothetical protein NZL90_03120 [Aquificaceae bacterium]|nr:hypothetical protein [Aquificaceae bacterium]MDW8236937.1 hypothetical protein [Aquificaceae bacterium]
MQELLRELYFICKELTDLRWGKSDDESISKVIKCLRAIEDGARFDDIISNKELSLGIESLLGRLFEFSQSNKGDIKALERALLTYVKSPVPCKIRILKLLEGLIEDN